MTTTQPRRCRIPNCPNTARPQRTLCDTHRGRVYRYGDPHTTAATHIDDIAADAVIRNRQPVPGLNPASRRLITQRLTACGLAAQEIARILGVAPRTVHRYRAVSRVPGSAA